MTPHEKAVDAINRRLERLQENLLAATSETARQFLFQSLVVTLGLHEAMTDHIKRVGEHAQRRHGRFKESTATVGTQHADLLKSGTELLEQLKANPTDRAIRQQIDAAQKNMVAIQKELRRGAFALQRELSLSMGMIDKLAETIRRLCEADASAVLKRAFTQLLEHVRELCGALETMPAREMIDTAAWEKSAAAEIDQATDFYDAYARAGYQAMIALEVMTLAMADNPPQTATDATQRANEAVAARLKDITARFAGT